MRRFFSALLVCLIVFSATFAVCGAGVKQEALVEWPKYIAEGKETLNNTNAVRLTGDGEEDETWQAIEEAYTYAFPLVLMDATKTSSTNTIAADDEKAPVNQLIHSKHLANADSKAVVTPNVDTIYTQSFLDLSQEPMVFEKPKTDRFCSVEMIDAYTNCVEILGTGGDTQEARAYLITGPEFKGTLPKGMTQVEMLSNMAWMIVRTMVENEKDMENVYAIQQKMSLTPLSEYIKNADEYISPQGTYSEKNDFVPIEHVLSLDPQSYFDLANKLMAENPPTAADAAALESFAKIGVGPRLDFDAAVLGEDTGKQWKNMLMELEEKWTQESMPFMQKNGEWSFYGEPIAEFGTEYAYRALVALGGLGANPLSVAMYPKAQTDGQEVQLNGKNEYIVHFDAAPPTEKYGFWSLTAYGENNFLIDNTLDRYAVNDRSDIKVNKDGSFDLYIQPQPPEDESLMGNWLPVKEEDFHLYLRIYLPNKSALSGDWKLPDITVA